VASNSSSSSGGVGFFGLLTVAFIVLKLTHVINWSWWWVLSPTLIPLGIGLVVLGIVIAVHITSNRRRRKLRSK
jgi:ABC-type antimicrobial peptide transport system permease subunit